MEHNAAVCSQISPKFVDDGVMMNGEGKMKKLDKGCEWLWVVKQCWYELESFLDTVKPLRLSTAAEHLHPSNE